MNELLHSKLVSRWCRADFQTSPGVNGMRCCHPLCHAELREELPSVAGAQEWAPECSQMEPGKGTAVSRRGRCSCLETRVEAPLGNQIILGWHPLGNSSSVESRGFHSADCSGRLSSLFYPVIFPSLYQVLAPSLLFLMHAMWTGELYCSKYYLGTMSLCIASICHSSGHRLPKESSFSC